MDAKKRLQNVLTNIRSAEKQAGRPENDVALLAVSKTWPADVVKTLAEAGQRDFGENYLQEALTKIDLLGNENLIWHFIGPIQSNKTQDIAHHFDWVHSVDRLKIIQRLSQQRPDALPPLNVCLQVNIDQEPQKSGVTPEALPALADAVIKLPKVALRGLMVIPKVTPDESEQRRTFARTYQLYQSLQSRFKSIDTLSMGMSADMTIAIAEGSNLVRVGTALFGERHTQQTP
ncbi:pyridoxal phosphate enzyme, YggS family [Methylophaga frappieri]|uniref:Pyridoxal phosphate homeostasis protein n=1 Tax=Methylophaga frappieri (strain ATCC BAA-2434 / DSM 25690 / JAM7) TaxID=754477 RepID=I1YIN4_METFJ|nr:YggS family pyridoxal phosphate-dependent enzyme [Methylophaga frappieri]AFJ02777.1 pyridoxal phosphate enzyme, YggS family [Methylophaga frappieri]